MRRAAIAGALGLVLVAAGAAAAVAQSPRDEALAALADHQNVDARRLGAARIGPVGTMDDLPVLVHALRDPDGLVRAVVERSMWQIWSRSGDVDVDRLFTIGVEQMTSRAGDDAIDTFTRVIDRRPEFAEGWNKRATVYYLMGEYAKSLADCDEVMKRNPYHFGALSGYGMIYTQLGNPERALEYFERALTINPNLDGVREAAEALRQLLQQRRKNTT